MNLTSPVIAITLLWCLQAQATPLQLSASNSNPYNSPIQRANPNSRQGSVPAAPPVRGPSTAPTYRTPSLDNRGIGNGDNLRRQQQVPNLEPSRPPRDNPRAP
ncbi:hypothetical protein ACIF8Z_11185 [Pseudomonas promysalinigenes]|jgi:hypothetical protein|uniref:Lipoprotein n=1 Tax=Pseudomonas promysalinigenes TaxID=485898 RepID=A0ABY6AHA6_9PSED|nr:hypothetical protein [Pseudomonas promysalinigenes]UXH38332.1 hypothetical protein N5C08_15200 [Pseudomonas promysalinigenes]